MGLAPFGSDSLFERCLHGTERRTVHIYKGSNPNWTSLSYICVLVHFLSCS